MSQHKYDVFISYSHKDNDWVQDQLIPKLTLRNFSIAIDSSSFSVGGFTVEEIERCIVESRRTILVLTPDYLRSKWTKLENVIVQTLDPSAKDRRLIPVKLKDCILPLRLQIYSYLDLTNNDPAKWDLLVQSLI